MVSKKKWSGEDLKKFVNQWYCCNHKEKVELSRRYGITYETARHIISDNGEAQSPIKKPVVETNIEDRADETQEAIREVLAIPTRTELDFCSFDIETTELKADFSAILSAVIKPFGRDGIVFRADNYKNWGEGRRADDLEICRDITNELSRHAIVVTHYGTGFDLRYIRAKLMKHGLPALPPMFAVDTYYIAKANMMVSRRRLDALCKYLSLGLKSIVEGNTWVDAALNGSKEALDEVVAHNVQDCILLEKLAMILFPYLRSIKKL